MTITSYTPQSTLMVVYTAPNGIYTDTYNGAVYLNTKSKILTGTLANLTWSGGTDISSQVGGIDPRTNVGPACCNFKGRLYVVYKAWDGPDLYMSYRDVSWHGDKSIHGNYGYITARTDSPPCLIEYDHTLYLFYKGDGTNEIRQATLNIDQWNGNQAVKIVNNASVPETDCSPTAGLFNRKLYLAYKGIGSSNKIYISIFDGSSWVGDRTIAFFGGTIDPETDCAPRAGII